MKRSRTNFNLDDYETARDVLLQFLSLHEDDISAIRLLNKASEHIGATSRKGSEIKPYLQSALFDLKRAGLIEDVPGTGSPEIRLVARGRGAFLVAARWGHIAVVKRLLEEGIESEAKNAALISAVINNRVEIVRLLLEAGADVNARESLFNRMPVMYVTDRTDRRIRELLKKAGG